MQKSKKGFTVIELAITGVFVLIFLMMLVVVGFIGPMIVRGNCWFDRATLLRTIQIDHPLVKEIIWTETHLTDPTIVWVENSDKTRDIYRLDSDILFEYSVEKIPRQPAPSVIRISDPSESDTRN